MPTRTKICCISSEDEAALAVSAGAAALGLVGPMPSGPGTLSVETAARLARVVPPGVDSFYLTSQTTAAGILAEVAQVRPTVVQVVQHIDPAEAATLRRGLGATRYVQVVHVEGHDALELIERYAAHADAFLLDSGRPSAPTQELGGTGRTHDWSVSRAFVQASPKPVWLAGGLKPDNARAAIEAVRPFGLDLCSGVRTDGDLDPEKLWAFMGAVRGSAPTVG